MNPDPDLALILMTGLAAPDAGADGRLARIEQAVDAIAVEMERVSEGQRFATKLLAERAFAERADGPAAPASR